MKAVTKNEWKRKNGAWCSISTDKKLATTQDHQILQKHRWKGRLSVLDPTFGCFYQISRKQILLV